MAMYWRILGVVAAVTCYTRDGAASSAFTFGVPRRGISPKTRSAFPSNHFPPLYASPKKQRGQEKARAAAEEELRMRKMRAGLELELQSILDTDKKSGMAKAVRKLLKNANHDGLTDVGDTARMLAVRCLARVGRYDEAEPLLVVLEKSSGACAGAGAEQTGSTTADDVDFARIALRSFAGAEKWDKAVKYADVLFSDDLCRTTEGSATNATANEVDDAMMAIAIQAYCITGHQLDRAQKLIERRAATGKVTAAEVHDLLSTVYEKGMYNQAREILTSFQDIGYNRPTYQLGLLVASELGDLSLAMRVFRDLKAKMAIRSEDIMACMDCFVKSFRASGSDSSPGDLHFASELLDELARLKKRIEPFPKASREFFSILLESYAEDERFTVDLRRAAFNASKLAGGNWPDWLSQKARVNMFPVLDDDEDLAVVFKSLPYSSNITEAIQTIGESSTSFWSAFIRLCDRRSDLFGVDSALEVVHNHNIVLESNEETVIAEMKFVRNGALKRIFYTLDPVEREAIARSSLRRMNEIMRRRDDDGLDCSPSLFLKFTEYMFFIMSIAGLADDINHNYSNWAQRFGQEDRLNLSLSFLRLESLATAHIASGDFTKAGELLFPSAQIKSKVPRETAEVSLLQEMVDTAASYDTADGKRECLDELARNYRKLITDCWGKRIFVGSMLKDVTPRPLAIEEALLGEQYTGFVFDLLENSPCAESWVRWAGDSLSESCWYISVLYTGQLFRQGKRVPEVRKAVIERMVNKLYHEFLKTAGKKKAEVKGAFKPAKRDQIDLDLSNWQFSVSLVYVTVKRVLDNISPSDLAQPELDFGSEKESALNICYETLIDQPEVKSLSRRRREQEFDRACDIREKIIKEYEAEKSNNAETGDIDATTETENRMQDLQDVIADLLLFGAPDPNFWTEKFQMRAKGRMGGEYDLERALSLLNDEVAHSGLGDETCREIFSTTANGMLSDLLDVASECLEKERVAFGGGIPANGSTVKTMASVVDFIVHSNRLFVSSPIGLGDTAFLPYSGKITRQIQEELYLVHLSSQEVNEKNDERTPVLLQELPLVLNISEERDIELMADAFAGLAPDALKGVVRGGLTGLFGSLERFANWLDQFDEEDEDEEGDDDKREIGGFGVWTE